MDDLADLAAPNCLECLEPMQPVVGAWWCQECKITVWP